MELGHRRVWKIFQPPLPIFEKCFFKSRLIPIFVIPSNICDLGKGLRELSLQAEEERKQKRREVY